jgi:hypothetical protein
MLGHHVLQVGERSFVEPREIVVELSMLGTTPPARCVNSGSAARASTPKTRGSPTATASMSNPHLRAHGVDDAWAGLEPAELLTQLPIDAELAQVNPEPDEARDARQVGIGCARADRRWVLAPHPPPSSIAIAALASRRVPPHLGGARQPELHAE